MRSLSGFLIVALGEPMFGDTRVDTVIQRYGTGLWGIDHIDRADDPRS